MTFDLTTQPWVPVVIGGARIDVSVRAALQRAHEIDGLAVDDPLQAVAVFRQVLLPVVLHAFGAPRTDDDWHERHGAGQFDDGALRAYLDGYADRFDLFHPTQPFAQVAGLQAANGATKPISLLVPQLASGNNVPLFSARTEADPPELSSAQAARAVLSAQCWDTAAIKSGAVGDEQMKAGKTTGNPTGPLGQLGVVVPTGATLFDTLLLSVPVLPQGLRPGDRPQWAGEGLAPSWRRQAALGLLDLLTWQSRRIRLVPDPDTDGEVTVSRVVLCGGDRIDVLPHDVEPHTGWKLVDKPKPGEPHQRPDRHQPGRSAWRGLATLVATGAPTSDRKTAPAALTQVAVLGLPEDFALTALVVGVVYGNQSSVIEDVVVDLLPLPVRALLEHDEVRMTLLDVVDRAEQLRVAANRLGDDLRAAAGVDKMPWDKGQRLGELLVHSFTPSVRRLLSGLQQHPDDAERGEAAWRTVARQLALAVAEPALDAVPATAYLGRKGDERHPARLAVAEAVFRGRLNDILGPVVVPAAAL